MGNLLKHFFNEQKILTSVIGRKTGSPLKLLEKADVVFISTPSQYPEFALNLLSKTSLEGKLIVSLGSCMSHDDVQLKQPLGTKVQFAFIHFLFGPSIDSFKDKNIIISGPKSNKYLKELTALFKNKGHAKVQSQSVIEHDKNMAYLQALSQFSSIALAKSFQMSGISYKRLINSSTITSSMNMATIKRILSQEASLWAYIQFENPFFQDSLDEYSKNVALLSQYVKEKDYISFEKMFLKLQKYWK